MPNIYFITVKSYAKHLLYHRQQEQQFQIVI
jgi:hypothetical protein